MRKIDILNFLLNLLSQLKATYALIKIYCSLFKQILKYLKTILIISIIRCPYTMVLLKKSKLLNESILDIVVFITLNHVFS